MMVGNTLVMKHAPGVPQVRAGVREAAPRRRAPDGLYSNVFLTNQQAATSSSAASRRWPPHRL
jgi:succinate-semialdehyde dehydrogenase/glutarate-semialdehyde dehydrogenase